MVRSIITIGILSCITAAVHAAQLSGPKLQLRDAMVKFNRTAQHALLGDSSYTQEQTVKKQLPTYTAIIEQLNPELAQAQTELETTPLDQSNRIERFSKNITEILARINIAEQALEQPVTMIHDLNRTNPDIVDLEQPVKFPLSMHKQSILDKYRILRPTISVPKVLFWSTLAIGCLCWRYRTTLMKLLGR